MCCGERYEVLYVKHMRLDCCEKSFSITNLRVNFSVDFCIVISKFNHFSYAVFGLGFIEGK